MTFLRCLPTCSIPTEPYSAVYMFFTSVLFILFASFSGFIFYVVPSNFNAHLTNNKSLHADFLLTVGDEGHYPDDELKLINDLKVNQDAETAVKMQSTSYNSGTIGVNEKFNPNMFVINEESNSVRGSTAGFHEVTLED